MSDRIHCRPEVNSDTNCLMPAATRRNYGVVIDSAYAPKKRISAWKLSFITITFIAVLCVLYFLYTLLRDAIRLGML
jgi:hypothetical protein